MYCTGLLIFLLSSSLLWSLSQSTQPYFAAKDCSGDYYSIGDTYRGGLIRLFTELSNNANNSIGGGGFYSASFPQNPNPIYGLYMCRGDITSEDCSQCVSTALGNITISCPNTTNAIIWYDLCMLRYTNQSSIFSTMQYNPAYYLLNVNNSTNSSQFRQAVIDLVGVGGLAKQAAYSTHMYADGARYYTSNNEIYGLVQCNPKISQDDCFNCLGQAEGIITTQGINGFEGARVLMPSCNLRYEIYPFYESSAAAAPAPSPLANPSGNGNTLVFAGNGNSSPNIVIITVVLATTAVILVSVMCICFCRRRKPKTEIDGLDEISMVQSLQFNFGTIRAATFNFSDLNKLGQGGFGPVYKGKLLNEQEIAVKRLSRHSGQGELEFKNEVELLAKLQHKNLVRLLGFSLQGEEKLLIYEFLPNTSLDHFIFDPIKRAHLDWETRHKIIRGITRGLLYLHEESRLTIIHRDLKASNILLDKKMNPKISDFGMARLFVVDETQNTNRIVGTYGYMAPEYAMHGFFSVKSDVFSFGVLLLEIVSGQKNNSFYQLEQTENLLSYAWRKWREDTPLELIDTTLRGNCSISEVMRCIHIGLLCVQENAADRPTMASVDLMFNSSSITLSIPSSPAFSVYNTREADKSSSWNDSSVTDQVSSTTKSTQRSTNGASSIELTLGEIHENSNPSP
ncbi:cysteine-rich receptor-like protein kinase 15 [Telopea speciosissima]|uniref:cysteine-rich receptor-like protein kinase 15 n=1 Tax=Telopea speciosissima TaxID=54955 RepID=UPI001CC39F0C|nr:cysteine-rich receptor-like protein kinase 15 [Telopea speciosissima]